MTTATVIPGLLRDLLALPPEASTFASDVDALHLVVITTTMVGATGVFLAAIYFTVRYKRRTVSQLTQRFETSAPVEATFIIGTLGLFIAFWLVGYRQYVEMEVPPKDALLVYVQAKQWMWKFTYPDGRSTNDELVVPSGRNVRLVMTSRDVIHSLFVPAFRMKQDVVPGRYVTSWFRSDRPGTYPILCAEYCGVSHSMMRGSVVVLDGPGYSAWLGGSAIGTGGPTLAAVGREAALRHGCIACHTLSGQRHVGPTWSRLYDSMVTLSDGRTVLADEAYLTRSMMEPSADIVATFDDVMPANYRFTLPQPEVAAIVEFIRSLKDGGGESDEQRILPALSVAKTADAGPAAGPPPGPHVALDAGPRAAEEAR